MRRTRPFAITDPTFNNWQGFSVERKKSPSAAESMQSPATMFVPISTAWIDRARKRHPWRGNSLVFGVSFGFWFVKAWFGPTPQKA
jgi:hypothetical protein